MRDPNSLEYTMQSSTQLSTQYLHHEGHLLGYAGIPGLLRLSPYGITANSQSL